MVPNSYEPVQFTLISMGLIRYSCGHISGHHDPIHVEFGVFFSSSSTEIWSWKCWNEKKKVLWRHTSVLYIGDPCVKTHWTTHWSHLLSGSFFSNMNWREIERERQCIRQLKKNPHRYLKNLKLFSIKVKEFEPIVLQNKKRVFAVLQNFCKIPIFE